MTLEDLERIRSARCLSPATFERARLVLVDGCTQQEVALAQKVTRARVWQAIEIVRKSAEELGIETPAKMTALARR